MFGDQTPSNIVCWPNILRFGHLVWCGLIVYDKIWRPSNNRSSNLKLTFLFSCLIGGVLLVWTAASNTLGVRMRTTLAQWLACVHKIMIPRLFLRTPLVEYFKNGERGKSFLDVAEIEEIETDEMPSRKRKQRTGKEMKWQRKASFDTPLYLEIIVMSNSHHFAETWSIFDHQFLYDIIVVPFLFCSSYPAPGLPSSIFSFSILL